jgi:heptosyltransferase III
MASILDQVSRGAQAVVIRLRSMGDCVLTTPALDILKRSRPDLTIAVVVEDRFAAVFDGNPDVSAILPPSGRAVANWEPELCLNLHGGTRSMGLTLRSGARFRAGFAHHRHSFIYNVQIPTAQEILAVDRKVHTAEHLAAAMFHLGAARCEIPGARLYAEESPQRAGRIAVLHPFASAPDKTWPAERFLAVARHLRTACRIEPVFVGTAVEDMTPFHEFRISQGAPTSQLMTLIAGAAAFVGNDSGPAHLAAGFGVPSVVIFGNSDAGVWGPWRATAEALVGQGTIASVETGQVVGALDRLRVAA